MTTVEVVILTWNDGDLLATAVESVLHQADVDVAVTVVDNGSTPPALVAARNVQTIRSETNLGVGGGRNLGVRAGSAPYVCVLDSDAWLHPHALAHLLEPLEHDDRIGLSAPVFSGQRPEASGGRAPTLRRKLLRAMNRTDDYAATPGQGVGRWWEVEFTIGACQLFRRDVFDAVGGLDASARFGPEDVDFCLRLRGAGWRVVQVDGPICDHPPRRAFRGVWTRRGAAHAVAFARHWWRQRRRATPATSTAGAARPRLRSARDERPAGDQSEPS
jgi:N-acetylglucosaminyl-diphospho-decaprenol L-rhamnosyltransferase